MIRRIGRKWSLLFVALFALSLSLPFELLSQSSSPFDDSAVNPGKTSGTTAISPSGNGVDLPTLEASFLETYQNYSQAVVKYGKGTKKATAAYNEYQKAYEKYRAEVAKTSLVAELKNGQAVVSSVVVNKKDFTLTVYSNGKIARIFPIAYGSNPDGLNKKAKGDCRTPEGAFKITRKVKNPNYYPLDGGKMIPGGDPKNPVGTRWMELNSKWGGIAFHGTTAPTSIGTKASHGCVRMYTKDAEELFDLIRVGTPVIIKGLKDS